MLVQPDTNSAETSENKATNGVHQDRLDIVIIGAGIGGLTAAIFLRKQGHRITILEQSQCANELGAAIHLAPNSNGILRRIGIYAEKHGANTMNYLTEFDQSGTQCRHEDLREQNKKWQHPWLLHHRVYLHEELKTKATSTDEDGIPVILRPSSRVIEVDPASGTAILESGERVTGDVVLGADGVHSKSRSNLACGEIESKSSGQNAFRFLIPRATVLEDCLSAKFAKKDGELIIWFASDRRVIMYPCSNNELLNFVCIHPKSESETMSSAWGKGVNVTNLLRVYRDFDPALLALLAKADSLTLKVWELLDMDKLPTLVNERLAVLGDAAHPFMPHQGQGAGCAMEDAASLGVVLSRGVTRSEVPERLRLYEKFRYERAHTLQEFSRIAGGDIGPETRGFNMTQYTNYNFGHDEWDNSMALFRKWDWARKPHLYWRMPVAFGPMPGPRQTFEGAPRPAAHSTFTTASVKFKTSRTLLQNLLPTDSYSFIGTGTVAHASFSQTTLDKMSWLGSGGYRHLGLYIHGVQYVKKNGQVIKGTYLPVLFESLTDPIVSGREELGMPKLYCSLDIYKRSLSYRIQAGWQGATFATIALDGLASDDPATEHGTIGGEADDGILAYKYIPRVGERGKSDAEYGTFVPHAEESRLIPSAVHTVARARTASVTFDPMDWDALPTLHHIVSRLAELPIHEVVSAKVVSGTGVPDVSSARRIE